jgi:hypothetical protein
MDANMTTSRSLISATQVTLDGYILDSKGEADSVDSSAGGLVPFEVAR